MCFVERVMTKDVSRSICESEQIVLNCFITLLYIMLKNAPFT